ncbi:amidohydrolase family protein, partial [Rahnella perminowiae]
MKKTLLRTVKNVRLPGREGLWQIDIDDTVIRQIVPQLDNADYGKHILDAEGGLAIPPFIEPHIHLDTTQTAGQPAWNQSGTLFEGIERWAERKALLSHEDVK